MQEITDEHLQRLDAARQEKYMTTVEYLNFELANGDAWFLLRKLGGGAPKQREQFL